MANENSVTEITNSAVGAIAPTASAAPAPSAAPDAITARPASALPAVAPPQALLYRDAYEQVLPATAAINEDEIAAVNVDVPSAVATTIGSLPKILAYRAEAEKLPRFDIAHFDDLKLRTFAVGPNPRHPRGRRRRPLRYPRPAAPLQRLRLRRTCHVRPRSCNASQRSRNEHNHVAAIRYRRRALVQRARRYRSRKLHHRTRTGAEI
jgi:hypothetical protein